MIRSVAIRFLFDALAWVVGRPPAEPRPEPLRAKSILLFKPDGIGDYILWTALLQEAARGWPQAKVTLLCCAPTGELARVMFPKWKIIEIPKRPKNISAFLWMLLKNPRLYRIERHGLLIDLRPHRASWELLYVILLRADQKIGLERSRSTFRGTPLPEKRFFNILIPQPPSDPVEREKLGCEELRLVGGLLSFFGKFLKHGTTPDLRSFVWPRPPLPSGERFWVIGPFSGNSIRDYPLSKWKEALKALACQVPPPDRLLICGAASQHAAAEVFRATLKESLPVENLCGSLGLAETAGLLLEAEMVFATESALAHMAVALRRPAVVILGGGHYGLFAPWGKKIAPVEWVENRIDCYGCNWVCIQPSAICIGDIPASRVSENSLKLIAKISFPQKIGADRSSKASKPDFTGN